MILVPEYKCLNCGNKRDGFQSVISSEELAPNQIERAIDHYMFLVQRNPERLICDCDENHVGCMVFTGFRIKQLSDDELNATEILRQLQSDIV